MPIEPAMRDFSLEVFLSKWEFAARHHLTASDSESVTLSRLLELATPADRDRFMALPLSYTQTFGSPTLREAIAATYPGLSAADILCFAGAEEGIYVGMRTLLCAGDHAIVMTPNYQAAETLPMSICEVTGVPLVESEDWALDVDAIQAAVRPSTRLISVNFPNNPTGAVPARAAFDALIELCRRRGIWLFSDEVYRGLERSDADRIPQAAELYERGISLNVMSKSYGLPGLRIGWVACRDRDLLASMERYKHYLSICNSAPSEVLAEIALKARDTLLARNRGLVIENLQRLDAFFARFESLFEWKAPKGGCVAFPRYLGSEGVEVFCRRLIEEAGVLLLPASIYRSELTDTPRDRFRIGFGRANLPAGVQAMQAWLSGAQSPVGRQLSSGS
jgi:aspartate/methionine/tyrosine aminotransferase